MLLGNMNQDLPFVRAPDDGGGGGGGDDIKDQIAKAVEEAVAGLKATNAELKKEKTEAKKQADALAEQVAKLGGDEGIEALVKMRASLENDEVGKLLASGNYEEWYEKRSGAMKADYEKQLSARDEVLTEREKALQAVQSQLHGVVLDRDIGQACDAAEISDPGAREHARMLAERQFQFDAELGQHVIRDKEGGIVYGKDGKTPKPLTEWLEEKREVPEYRLWWPGSQPAGLGNAGLPSNPDRKVEAMGKMDMAEFRKVRAEQKKGAA